MLAGFTKPEWCGEDEVWREVWNKAKHGGPPLAARIGVLHKEYTEPAYAVAHWTDYCPEEAKDRFMWDKMSAHMLLKCAKACCLRENFPVLSGIYTDDEMAQAGPGDPIKVRVHDDREYDREFIPDVQTPQVEGDTASPSPDPIQLLQSEFMELATTKWGHLENGARKAAVAEWISTCKALAWLEERGSHSVKASNEEQLRAAIELLQSYDPSSEPATETVEGELVEEDPDLVALIEQYERQLSSIADETQRLDWRKAELARARAEWTAEHEGEPVGKAWGRHNNLADWTDEQRFNWSSYLEGRLEAPTQSEGGLRF